MEAALQSHEVGMPGVSEPRRPATRASRPRGVGAAAGPDGRQAIAPGRTPMLHAQVQGGMAYVPRYPEPGTTLTAAGLYRLRACAD